MDLGQRSLPRERRGVVARERDACQVDDVDRTFASLASMHGHFAAGRGRQLFGYGPSVRLRDLLDPPVQHAVDASVHEQIDRMIGVERIPDRMRMQQVPGPYVEN